MTSIPFAPRRTRDEIENGRIFTPKFGDDGLIPVIAQDASSGEVLMFAWMNADALARTIATGEAHYWSRSRKALWRKGETSGNVQRVVELRTDCDQDAILLCVEMGGSGGACHLGYRTCFYRGLASEGADESGPSLRFVESERRFDPAEAYRHDSADTER